MYNSFDELHEALYILIVQSLMVEAGIKSYEGTTATFGSEDFYETFVDGIHSVFEHTDYGDYDEETDEYSFIFTDRCFTEYFKLCRRYGLRNKIPFDLNPYVHKGLGIVDDNLSGPYTCWHELCTKRGKTALHFHYSSDFCYEYELLERLIDSKQLFEEGIEELKAVLAKPKAVAGKAAA